MADRQGEIIPGSDPVQIVRALATIADAVLEGGEGKEMALAGLAAITKAGARFEAEDYRVEPSRHDHQKDTSEA
jgi:hypothetical protein